MKPRLVMQFSCGAASAVAARLTVAEWRSDPSKVDILVVNAFIQEEHEDNRRFLNDVAAWLGIGGVPFPITVLRDEKFNASMKNRFTAPCSQHLKQDVLKSIAQPGDVSVIGYTGDDRERERAVRLEEMFSGESFRFPLIEAGLTKSDCLAMVERAGIALPYMYRLGYRNANCIGCVKGGEGYWNKIRRDFPERFIQIADIQESLGPGA